MWIEHVRAVGAATKTITKEQFYELRYEDLHAWNLELLNGVCCFLQLDWDEAAMKKAIAENQVVVICGETGSGKTTQIPKICLELGRGVSCDEERAGRERGLSEVVVIRIVGGEVVDTRAPGEDKGTTG